MSLKGSEWNSDWGILFLELEDFLNCTLNMLLCSYTNSAVSHQNWTRKHAIISTRCIEFRIHYSWNMTLTNLRWRLPLLGSRGRRLGRNEVRCIQLRPEWQQQRGQYHHIQSWFDTSREYTWLMGIMAHTMYLSQECCSTTKRKWHGKCLSRSRWFSATLSLLQD